LSATNKRHAYSSLLSVAAAVSSGCVHGLCQLSAEPSAANAASNSARAQDVDD
jgi:hypothetical protein